MNYKTIEDLLKHILESYERADAGDQTILVLRAGDIVDIVEDIEEFVYENQGDDK
jgi:hypothetical protein